MLVQFYKYEGAGNDFVIIDNRTKTVHLTEKQILFLCDRKFGIGADGLILLQQKEGYDFEMVYYNSDGKLGSMCGNGSRCLTKFASDCGIKKDKYFFVANDGDHESQLEENGWIRVKMIDVNEVMMIDEDVFLSTGSPHYIKKVKTVDDYNVFEEGKAIRNSERFINEGTNVNFIEKISNNSIKVRTYERGVEDETLSCGTGVTASAIISNYSNGFNKIDVKTLGGDLAVEFEKINDKTYRNIWLIGPATFVFRGEIEV